MIETTSTQNCICNIQKLVVLFCFVILILFQAKYLTKISIATKKLPFRYIIYMILLLRNPIESHISLLIHVIISMFQCIVFVLTSFEKNGKTLLGDFASSSIPSKYFCIKYIAPKILMHTQH